MQQPAQLVSGIRLKELVSPLLTPGAPNLVIDGFSTTQSTIATPPAPSSDSSSLKFSDESEVIGGERDLSVELLASESEIRLRVNPFGLRDVLQFDGAAGSDGRRTIVWDGIDNDGEALAFGLGGRDLTLGGANRGILFRLGVDENGGEIRMRYYTGNGATFSEAIVELPITGGTADELLFVPFTQFRGTAQPNNVDAIELILVAGSQSVDGQIDFVGATGAVEHKFANETLIDLELTKSVDRNVVDAGESVRWTLVLTNNDRQANVSATNVSVSDPIPNGFTLLSSEASAGSYRDGIWSLQDPLLPGAVVTLELSMRADYRHRSDAVIENVAQVVSADQRDFDSRVNNDGGDQSEDDEDSARVMVLARPVSKRMLLASSL